LSGDVGRHDNPAWSRDPCCRALHEDLGNFVEVGCAVDGAHHVEQRIAALDPAAQGSLDGAHARRKIGPAALGARLGARRANG
jgi:hypothetical protein